MAVQADGIRGRSGSASPVRAAQTQDTGVRFRPEATEDVSEAELPGSDRARSAAGIDPVPRTHNRTQSPRPSICDLTTSSIRPARRHLSHAPSRLRFVVATSCT